MPKLSDKQWAEKQAPFCFLHINAPAHWQEIHFSMIEKWLNANVQGWWYSGSPPDDKRIDRRVTYVYERNADRVLFKIWISDDPFRKDAGDVVIVNVVPGNEDDL